MAVQMIGAIKRYTGTAAEIGNFSLVGVPVGSTFFESDTGQLKILSAAGTLVNAPSESVTLSGSYVRLSTEPLPTVLDDGVQDGNDLLVIDPADKNNNKVYVYRTGAWREI